MSPEEVSEIISKFYTNKTEDQIKLFEFYKDELKDYKEQDVYDLIKEEIETPGIIDCFLKHQGNLSKVIVKSSYNKEIKNCYRKIKNRWYLNELLQRIQDDKTNS
jgi:DNA-binding protein Fis